jgi:hypothetical protein
MFQIYSVGFVQKKIKKNLMALRVGVGVVCYRAGAVLLVQRANPPGAGTWRCFELLSFFFLLNQEDFFAVFQEARCGLVKP